MGFFQPDAPKKYYICWLEGGPVMLRDTLPNTFCEEWNPQENDDGGSSDSADPPPDPATPDKIYTINLPGFTDFIRVPALENKELKKQRVIRMKTSNSAVPESLRWISTVMTALDNAQDLLYTGLYIARPLLRRLPARFIPWLGWVLLANDVVNISTSVLGAAHGGRSWKRNMMTMFGGAWGRRRWRMRAVANFFNRTPIFPIVIQGAQALQTLTGYGLTLGSMMGTVSDTFWGFIRTFQGGKLEIKGPPPADPLAKAARFMSLIPILLYHKDKLSKSDNELIMAAACLGSQLLADGMSVDTCESRHDELFSLRAPAHVVWDETTAAALDEAEIPRMNDDDCLLTAGVPELGDNPTYGELLKMSSEHAILWEDKQGQSYKNSQRGSVLSYTFNNAMYDLWRWQANDIKNLQPEWDPIELDAASAIEFNVFPIGTRGKGEIQQWLDSTRVLSQSKGFTRASYGDLQLTAVATMGGFERRQFETLNQEPALYDWPKVQLDVWIVELGENGTQVSYAIDKRQALLFAANYHGMFPDKEIWIKHLGGQEHILVWHAGEIIE